MAGRTIAERPGGAGFPLTREYPFPSPQIPPVDGHLPENETPPPLTDPVFPFSSPLPLAADPPTVLPA